MYKLFLIIILSIFWFILSGYTDLPFIVLGTSSTLLTLYLLYKTSLLKADDFQFFINLKFFSYFIWLIKEIINSSIDVLKIVWQKEIKVNPCFGEIMDYEENNIGKTIYANSIILTPGTVTVKAGNKLFVHALTEQNFDSLSTHEMDLKIKNIYTKKPKKKGKK